MQISDVYLGLGQDVFGQLIRGISIGKLRTYQIYEGFKVRAHLQKVNTESLRKSIPKLWARISEGDDDFAKDLAQAILVSHLDMICSVCRMRTGSSPRTWTPSRISPMAGRIASSRNFAASIRMRYSPFISTTYVGNC